MYDSNATYEDNFEKGPHVHFTREERFPKLRFLGAPAFTFLGVPLYLPIGIPAGPLLNSRFVEVALDAGFCLPVYKTVRSRFVACHSWPNILKVDTLGTSLSGEECRQVIAEPFDSSDYVRPEISITNSFGVPSKDPSEWRRDFGRLSSCARPGFHPVLSFQGTRVEGGAWNALVEDTLNTARMAAKTVLQHGFGIIELNLSCPNEGSKPLFRDINRSAELLAAVRKLLQAEALDCKLIAKIGALPDADILKFVELTAKDIDGVSAINTISAKIFSCDGHSPALGKGRETGGVCGNAIFDVAIHTIRKLHEARLALGLESQSWGLIGVGGVSDEFRFERMMEAGADLVQAATGAMWNLSLAAQVARACAVPFCEE